MASALQKTPITFRSRSPPCTQIPKNPSTKLSLTSIFTTGIKLPKLTIKLHRSTTTTNRGASGARMADSASMSYANALADVAKSNGTLEQTVADLDKLEKIFKYDGVLKFFTDPTLSISEKYDLVDEIAKSSEIQPHVANFLNILVDMKRIDIFNEIVKDFEIVYNKLTNTELVVVTSVVKLESQHLSQIAKGVQKLTGSKNVRIKTLIDPSLVAGFTIRYGSGTSKLIDMSVKKQLDDIAAQLDLGDIQLAV